MGNRWNAEYLWEAAFCNEIFIYSDHSNEYFNPYGQVTIKTSSNVRGFLWFLEGKYYSLYLCIQGSMGYVT